MINEVTAISSQGTLASVTPQAETMIVRRRRSAGEIRSARELRDKVYFSCLKLATHEGREILLSAAEHSDSLDIGLADESRGTAAQFEFSESFIEQAIRQARQSCHIRPWSV